MWKGKTYSSVSNSRICLLSGQFPRFCLSDTLATSTPSAHSLIFFTHFGAPYRELSSSVFTQCQSRVGSTKLSFLLISYDLKQNLLKRGALGLSSSWLVPSAMSESLATLTAVSWGWFPIVTVPLPFFSLRHQTLTSLTSSVVCY